MADGNFEKEPLKKKTKRSRHWDEKETEILVSKWSEENIQERLKSCTRKKAIWKEISNFLNASDYDRDDESCKVRIHTLITAYRNYRDVKRNSTGAAPPKMPPCYEEIDNILGDKPTTLPSHLISSSGSGGGLNVADDNGSESSEDVNDDITLQELINSTQIPIATNSEMFHDEDETASVASTSCSSTSKGNTNPFYLKKKSKKSSRSDKLFDALNYSMNSFMKAQSEADKEFLTGIFENKKGEDQQIVIRVREKGDAFCIEVELDAEKCKEKLLDVIKTEFELNSSQALVVTKLPDIMIRNDKDVKRLKDGDELEFFRIEIE